MMFRVCASGNLKGIARAILLNGSTAIRPRFWWSAPSGRPLPRNTCTSPSCPSSPKFLPAPALRYEVYAEPPFGPLRIPAANLRAALEGQKSIGEELLLRFNCEVLHIEPMGRAEIRQRIVDICRAGGHGNLLDGQIDKLLGEVLASRVPHRALESLITRIQTYNASLHTGGTE